jgi:serine/threonine protein kinase
VIFIIAQKPPPTFKNEKEWSSEFLDFTSKCLQKDPKARPTAKELLSVRFVLSLFPSSVQTRRLFVRA